MRRKQRKGKEVGTSESERAETSETARTNSRDSSRVDDGIDPGVNEGLGVRSGTADERERGVSFEKRRGRKVEGETKLVQDEECVGR